MHLGPAVRRAAPLGAGVLALGWLAMRTHQNGHDWGDDFALYIRQARGIVEGFPAQVGEDNRAALDASSWHTFSPEVYPWGFPLLLAPVVLVAGGDYGALKMVGLALWCIALLSWHLVARDRSNRPTAWVLMIALGASWPMAVWTNSIASDIPYLGVAFGTLAWLDHCRRRDAFRSGSLAPLVALGLLLAFAFNVRREGLALVAAVVAFEAVLLLRDRATFDRRRALLPLGVFLAVSAGFQLLIPSVVAPRYPGAGLSNVGPRLEWYRGIAAEQLGLMGPRDDQMQLVGSHMLAAIVLGSLVTFAVAGVVARCIVSPLTDLPLAAFAGAHLAIVLVSPFQEGRYLFPVVAPALWFAVAAPGAVATVLRRPPARGLPSFFAALPLLLVVAALAGSSTAHTWQWGSTASDLRNAGAQQNGPTRPEAVEMFDAVRQITGPDDVVAFFRARAMTMTTERRSLQSAGIETIIRNADWYVMERGSTYSQPLLSLDEAEVLGLERTWSNAGWIMFRITDEARDTLDE